MTHQKQTYKIHLTLIHTHAPMRIEHRESNDGGGSGSSNDIWLALSKMNIKYKQAPMCLIKYWLPTNGSAIKFLHAYVMFYLYRQHVKSKMASKSWNAKLSARTKAPNRVQIGRMRKKRVFHTSNLNFCRAKQITFQLNRYAHVLQSSRHTCTHERARTCVRHTTRTLRATSIRTRLHNLFIFFIAVEKCSDYCRQL